MKHLTLIFTIGYLLLQNTGLWGQVVFIPAKPKAGETVEFSYDPTGGNLSTATVVKASIMYIDNKPFSNPPFVPISIQKEGKFWQGEFEMSTDEVATGVLIVFRDAAGKIIDTNRGKGYAAMIHDYQGVPIPKANVCLSIALDNAVKNKTLKFAPDRFYQLSLLEKEFQLNPNLKKNYRGYYLMALANTQRKENKEVLYRELEEMEKSAFRHETWALLEQIYRRIGEYQKADYYAKKVREVAPKSEFAGAPYIEKIMMEADPQKKLALFEEFEKMAPDSKWLALSSINIAYLHAEKGNCIALKKLMERYENQLPEDNKEGVYHNIAKALIEGNHDLKVAEEYAFKAEKLNPTNKNYLFTVGLLKEKQGKDQEAFGYFKKALAENIASSNPEINEHYVLMAVKLNQKEEALLYAEQCLKADKATAKTTAVLKELYGQQNGMEAANKYIGALKSTTKSARKEELMRELIEEAAPDFTLQDIHGKNVSLSDFKGKTIVLDFWATWCGPCIKSFPAMRRVQQKYSSKNVQFLFVNTFERGEGTEQKVKDFISKNKYDDLTVPIDINGGVHNLLRVIVLPTKMVIDPKGNIRFRSTGFDGDDAALEQEIDTMLEIVAQLSK